MAQGLGEQALVNLLHCPPEQHVAQLDQFESFVLGQRRNASEVNSQATAESITKAQYELRLEQARNEALNRTVETLSARPAQPRPIRMDPPKFDGTSPHTIVHWILAVEQCGVAQLIEDDTILVSYAMSNLRGKASEWAYSALMANADAFLSWAIFKSKIRAMYQPPNNKVLLMARFFGARQAKRSLQEFVQEMRSLSASMNGKPIPERIKVATFMNGLRHGPSRQALFRKVLATMEEAIDIALVEEQSYNSASSTAYYRPSSERSDATPMELGNADVICYKCGKRGHMMACCYSKVAAGAKAPSKRSPNPKGGAKDQRARRTGSAPAQDGSGNAGAQ
ncbi:unnamed protein product [Peronospora effusa]|nr:unnamed protein product [Peronospora effusa]